QEALLLRQHGEARAAIKRWVEMPDADADRIIRSLYENHWVVSGKLCQALPAIFEEGGAFYGVQGHLVEAVRVVFEDGVGAAPRR
ncbi:MAG: hypothetical protein Q7U58_20270, partial [Hydrogenophaga sp.]|nr:hypothetical protein [Hydrogenophaga sp.]